QAGARRLSCRTGGVEQRLIPSKAADGQPGRVDAARQQLLLQRLRTAQRQGLQRGGVPLEVRVPLDLQVLAWMLLQSLHQAVHAGLGA
ncbi:hypothetical protein Q6265_28495, partial [Klebsiella pneumoniae]